MKKITCLLLPVLLLSILSCKKDSSSTKTGINSDTVTKLLATAATLSFSGYTWTIKDSSPGTAGPGPNNWAAANAFVDANGYLHLKLTKVNGNGIVQKLPATKISDTELTNGMWKAALIRLIKMLFSVCLTIQAMMAGMKWILNTQIWQCNS